MAGWAVNLMAVVLIGTIIWVATAPSIEREEDEDDG